jgi:hypothetical protein
MHPKAEILFYFCNGPLWLPFTKKMMIFWNYLNICIFYQYGIMVVLFQEIFWINISPPLHCLSKTFILNFVHHHFLPKLLQELRYLSWFIFIILITSGASQNKNVMIFILFFAMKCLVGLSPKLLGNPLLTPK